MVQGAGEKVDEFGNPVVAGAARSEGLRPRMVIISPKSGIIIVVVVKFAARL